jgi:putative acetyltransferase
VEIKRREPADDQAIARLNDSVFGGKAEARLIEDLRAAELAAIELVAIDHAAIVGHILFSALVVAIDGKPVRALALAPLSVRPDHQRVGVGSALVRAGLERARLDRWQGIIVLGHPGYYPRFGFSAELARPLKAPFSGNSFMALEIVPGTLRGRAGHVVYPAAFGAH